MTFRVLWVEFTVLYLLAQEAQTDRFPQLFPSCSTPLHHYHHQTFQKPDLHYPILQQCMQSVREHTMLGIQLQQLLIDKSSKCKKQETNKDIHCDKEKA